MGRRLTALPEIITSLRKSHLILGYRTVEITSLKSCLESKLHPFLVWMRMGIYNDRGIFDTIPAVFDYCHQQGIPIVMMTNNATQSIDVIYNKMASKSNFTKPNIISSGCGLIDLPNLNAKVKNKRVCLWLRILTAICD